MTSYMEIIMRHSLVIDGSSDDEEDDMDDIVNQDDNYFTHITPLTISKDCCVKTVLATTLVTTAILLVVIAASQRKSLSDSNSEQSVPPEGVYWLTSGTSPYLVFRHQFLIHDVRDHDPMQILAVDDVNEIYVTEIRPGQFQHYNVYSVVNFRKSTTIFLVVSKSKNAFNTNFEEGKVLLCTATRFERNFQGSFASVADIMKVNGKRITEKYPKSTFVVSYIGDLLRLGRIASLVVNASCEALSWEDTFNWADVNESLACGERVSTETDYESCPLDACQSYPGIPLTRGQTCHKFRRCNFVMATCDPFYRQNPRALTYQPYCSCRKTAAEDARRLACPRVQDDGGECEIPRRDLLFSQTNLACQCSYKFTLIYPYIPVPEFPTDSTKLQWKIQEHNVTGPALKFSQCPC